MMDRRLRLLSALLCQWLSAAGVAAGADCNGNGREDSREVQAGGGEVDANQNGLPDECETPPIQLADTSDMLPAEELTNPLRAFAAADFNGDGRLDVLSVHARVDGGGPAVSLFVHTAEGVLVPREAAENPGLPRLTAGDFNGDGALDVACVERESVWALWNDGSGDFGEGARVASADGLAALQSGDVGADGRADVVAAFRSPDRVAVWQGQAAGGFQELAATPADVAPAALALCDLDGDGVLDVALGSLASGGTSWLRGRGQGAFGELLPIESSDDPREIIVARDWNGDGRTDIATMSRFSLVVVLARGAVDVESAASSERAAAGFEAPVRFAIGRELLPIRCAAALDAHEDGDLDLLLGLGANAGLTFVLNRGDGAFRASTRVELEAAPVWIEAADMDRDGSTEILCSLLGQARLAIFETAAGPPSAPAAGAGLELESDNLHVGFEPHSCGLADIDNDGDLDLAVIDGETNANILSNPGDGQFQFLRSYRVRDSMEMLSLLPADLDADGAIDVALADEYTSNVLVLRNQGAGNLRQNGTYPVGERPNYLQAGDIDGDNTLDLVCVDTSQNSISSLRGRSRALFADAVSTPVRSQPMAGALGDLRGNGVLDLAVAGYGTSQVLLLENDGKGRFRQGKSLQARWPTFVMARDFDADGKVDLAVNSNGARQVLLFWNQGVSFEPGSPLSTRDPPFTAIAPDLDGDKLLDIITSNTHADTIAIFINSGQRQFSDAVLVDVGSDPRFSVAGDIDGDRDTDVIVANHSSLDLTVLRARTARPEPLPAYLHRIVSEKELHALSAPPSDRRGRVLRQTKFVIPAAAAGASSDAPADLLEPVFQDVNVMPLHQEFLATAFPERFPALGADAYDALTGRRASRKYWSGVLYTLRGRRGPEYGFTLLSAFDDDPRELPTVEEARGAYGTLAGAFRLRPLSYYPDQGLARDAARSWKETGFPVLIDAPPGTVPAGVGDRPAAAFEVYTAGVGFGRLRCLSQAAFLELNARGGMSFQDILVLERAPRDVEGVLAGIITAEKQGELSHVALRTARRGTPNAYVEGAMAQFAALEGRLVRLEVDADGARAAEAAPDEAAAWWRSRQAEPVRFPRPDTRYAGLDGLAEIAATTAVPPEARFGGKASNFARLWSILEGPFARYRERGFAVPVHYYEDFISTAAVTSARDPGRDVTARELLEELESWPAFASDSRLRFEVLARFRAELEARGEVNPDVVHRIARRIVEVFGRADIGVRFRSSSNIEDALEFNGAGLYESTSACAADDLDGDAEGPSRCDPTRPIERDIARALKRVWSSLWSFRAYEERAFHGIPQEQAKMAVLVSLAFPDERANGVAMSGNPFAAGDARFLVTAQVGEESVVSPEPGVLAERSLVAVENGAVQSITRAQASSRAPAGSHVIADGELEELAVLLEFVHKRLPVSLGGRRAEDVLLDFEFKVDAAGCVAVKQVRPFLRTDAAPPAPAITLVVPAGARACGVFVASRAPARAWELKSVARFRSGRHTLRVRDDAVDLDLIEELTVGPLAERARPLSPGRIVADGPAERGGGTLRLLFGQEFELADGRDLTVELRLEVPRSPGSDHQLVLDEAYLSRSLAMQANLGQVITFASCNYAALPLWEVLIEAEQGFRMRLLERHEPPPTLNDTGPAALVRAELAWQGRVRVVEGYESLQYTALRHNRAPRYWIALDPPPRFAAGGAPAPLLELVAPEPRLNVGGEARFLDAGLEPLAVMSVAAWDRRAVIEAPPPLLVRGDADGSGSVDTADAVVVALAIIHCESVLARPEAADFDRSGDVTPLDIAAILEHGFGLAPPGR